MGSKENPHSTPCQSKDNAMVGSGFSKGLDVIQNTKDYDEDCFSSILNIFDFPMESLEDGGFEENWDARLQGLGPISFSSEPLRGVAPVSHVTKHDAQWNMIPVSSVLSGGTSQLKEQPNLPEEKRPVDPSDGNNYGLFEVPSPKSVLGSSSSPAEKALSVGQESAIPVRTRSKRPQRPNPKYFPSDISSSDKTSHPKRTKEKKEKRLSHVQGPTEMKKSLERPPAATKKCSHCEITKTPQWREGPMGPKTLCNACGVRYRSGRLFPEYRPAASPTFVPSLHSNSHKKVIQLRTKAITQEVVTGEIKPPVSPEPKFVPLSSGYLFDQIYD